MEYLRKITVNVSKQKVYFFLREVRNLPVWTRFFKSCISCNESVGEMETIFGKSITSIQEETSHFLIKLFICSKFSNRQEQALITIEDEKKKTNVTFHLYVPPEINQEQIEKMVINLEDDLAALKQHLESINA